MKHLRLLRSGALCLVLGAAVTVCAGDKEDPMALLLLGMGGQNQGVVPITVDESEAEVYVPTGTLVVTPAPEGDTDVEIFTLAANANVDGFMGTVASAGGASELMDRILGEISGESGDAPRPYATSSLIIRQEVDGVAVPTELAQVEIEMNGSATSTLLNNQLIQLIGTLTEPGGTVEGLPEAGSDEIAATKFRVIIQASEIGGVAAVLVGVSPDQIYPEVEQQLAAIIDGSNLSAIGLTPENRDTSFVASAQGGADFLFVVDNSGSMRDEQASVRANALAFFDRLEAIGVDFKIGVITTDSSVLRGTGFTSDRTQFEQDIEAGLRGSGTEAGIWQAEQALLADSQYGPGNGSVPAAGYPRPGAALAVIMVSDEGDQYYKHHSGRFNARNPDNLTFNTTDNVFLNNGYTVYGIIGLDETGAAGTCTGTVGKARASNNAYTPDDGRFNGNVGYKGYRDLARDTGGAVSSICSNNYGAFLTQLADRTAAAASPYTFDSMPISSSLNVYVNGVRIERTAAPAAGVTGYLFDASSNRLNFTGTQPPAGAQIFVSYLSFPEPSGLAALISQAGGGAGWVLLAALLFGVGGLLSLRLYQKSLADAN
ncbi:MAG: VWA domain-containing protein [bacterium]|nr:VWA domain-containing protein [bacterium]